MLNGPGISIGEILEFIEKYKHISIKTELTSKNVNFNKNEKFVVQVSTYLMVKN